MSAMMTEVAEKLAEVRGTLMYPELNDLVWTDVQRRTEWEVSVVPGPPSVGGFIVFVKEEGDDDRQAVHVSFDQWDQIVAAVAEARKV